MRFEGSESYVATADLKLAVNAALALERPLLVKGEPGTGKTLLAETVANALGRPLHQWHVKSTTKAQQGLYEYDAVSRLRDSQLGDGRVGDIAHYIKPGVLWEALEVFFNLREVPGLKKKPSTSELLDWLKLLLAEDIPPEALKSGDRKAFIPPLHGALLKNEQDVHLFERVVFMARAGR